MDNVNIDFKRESIVSNGLAIPFDMLRLNAEATYNATYTIKNTYETSSGKLSEAYGSVVFWTATICSTKLSMKCTRTWTT